MKEENTKYLYGTSVQGIQDFIFQTNELKDIVGASGLVEQICKATFQKYVGAENLIVKAAGNIKCIFTSKDKCANAVRNFPKDVMELAPGITITQAVVEYDADFKKAAKELDKKLNIQRNRPMHSLTLGLMGITRSQKTGLPAIKQVANDYIDEATDKKRTQNKNKNVESLCKNCLGNDIDYQNIAFNIDEMTQENDWIAIIHADGNGLGKIISQIGGDDKKLKHFSETLDKITQEAAQAAFKEIKSDFNKDKDDDKDKKIPVRPIILGGDDFTVICRADLAIKYTEAFMKTFEKQSSTYLSKELKSIGLTKLTACAGIAFIKSSYPFYYGYDLAEELCNHAKNAERDKTNKESCLMFHKVQDSFVENYNAIIERELTPRRDISLKYGPYYLSDTREANKSSISYLLDNVDELKKNNPLKSHLRQWLSLLFTNPSMAGQKVERMRRLFNKDIFINDITNLKDNKTPAYDILSLHSIIYQKTK